MATKKQHTDFNRSVSKYLESIGAETKGKSSFNGEWILKTVAGDLNICVREPERSEVFSLFCQFQDVEKAKQFIPTHAQRLYKNNTMNGYSGKWNFHAYDANELLQEFKTELSSLLPVIQPV